MTVQVRKKRVMVLGDGAERLHPVIRDRGLEIVDEEPEIILTFGGDGLLLGSEREWPGIPKLPLRNSRHGKKCEPHQVEVVLDRLIAGEMRRREFTKVAAEALASHRVGLNDVIVHNACPTSSVRYRVWIDGRLFGEEGDEIVGDGVVVSTAFGSTAYYRSITGSIFRVGLGLAFNNSTEPVDHLVLPEDSEIRVEITRGPAIVSADNDPAFLHLDDGDEVRIRRADEAAVILTMR